MSLKISSYHHYSMRIGKFSILYWRASPWLWHLPQPVLVDAIVTFKIISVITAKESWKLEDDHTWSLLCTPMYSAEKTQTYDLSSDIRIRKSQKKDIARMHHQKRWLAYARLDEWSSKWNMHACLLSTRKRRTAIQEKLSGASVLYIHTKILNFRFTYINEKRPWT